MKTIYIAREGKQFGPFSEQDINSYVRDGKLLPTDFARYEGANQWQPASQILGFAFPISPNSPPLPPPANAMSVQSNGFLSGQVSSVYANPPQRPVKKGSSLFRFVISAILRILLAILVIVAAMPALLVYDINKKAGEAKNKRNAQNIASVFGAAVAAGATERSIDPLPSTSLKAAIERLQTGVEGEGSFREAIFKVELSDAEATEATPYLTLSGGNMTYSPGAGSKVAIGSGS